MPQTQVILSISSLILDDDKDLLGILRHKLEKLEYNGLPYTNYKLFDREEELKENLSDSVHVVVLDHYLATVHRTGLDVIKDIKHKNAQNFVIGYSGLKDPAILIEYINSGCDRFVDKDKPDNVDRLAEFIIHGLQEAHRRSNFFNYMKSKFTEVTNDKGTN